MLTGCSRFSRDWKAAVAEPVEINDLRGPWEGTWSSEKTGHSGKLRCLIEPTEGQEYLARFRATWGGIFVFRYDMTLTAEHDGGGDFTYFTGEANLGWLAGGVYRYEGRASGTEFYCSYESKGDFGSFTMTRPQGTAVPEVADVGSVR